MLQQKWYTQQFHATQCIQQTEPTNTKIYTTLPDKTRNGKTELLGSMAINMKIMLFSIWRYQHFRETWCLHIHNRMAYCSTLQIYQTMWRHIPQVHNINKNILKWPCITLTHLAGFRILNQLAKNYKGYAKQHLIDWNAVKIPNFSKILMPSFPYIYSWLIFLNLVMPNLKHTNPPI